MLHGESATVVSGTARDTRHRREGLHATDPHDHGSVAKKDVGLAVSMCENQRRTNEIRIQGS